MRRANRKRAGITAARPPRPSMPPTVPLAAALWAGAALSYGGTAAFGYRACIGCAVAGVVGAILAAVPLIVARKKAAAQVLLLIVMGFSAGAASGAYRAASFADQETHLGALPAGSYRFEAIADAKGGEFGPACNARVRLDDGGAVSVAVRYPSEAGLIRYGTVFEAHVRFSRLSDSSRSFYRASGVAAIATADKVAIEPASDVKGRLVSLRSHALSQLDGYEGSGAAFLRAVLLGDRSELDGDRFYQQVKAVGLAHVVAVSGAHLCVVCMLVGAMLSIARVPKRIAVVLQVGFIVGYLVCTGMPISGVRAALMASVALSSVYARRRSSSLSALAVCACSVIAADPTAALSASFALSVFATGGIVVFGGLAREWCTALLRGRASSVCDAIALTAASSVFVAPLSASLFSQVPLVSPLANLYAAPFFALFCGGGLIVVGANCVAPEAARWMLDALVAAAEGFCEGVGALASIPFAAVPCDVSLAAALGISAVAAAALWLAWPKPSFCVLGSAILACVVLACSAAAMPRGNEIIMLDVGQGDAIVVRSGRSAVLIDTGNRDAKLLSGLARNGVHSLDAVIISHPDDDHCASLAALDGVVRIGRVCVAADLLACPCEPCTDLRETAEPIARESGLVGLAVGDTVQVGDIGLRTLAPDRFTDGGGNADSLCLLMECDADGDGVAEWTGLFCGDAEDDRLDGLLASGMLGEIDVYKAGHHGSGAAIDSGTAAALSPSVSLVSVGADNRYGHPAHETLEALTQAGSMVYRTDEQGDVVCRMTLDRMEISTHTVE